MGRLNIPRSEVAVLRDLAELSDDSFSEFLKGLTAVEPEVSQIDISELVSKRVPSINRSTMQGFLGTLFSVYRIMGSQERSAHEVAADVSETIERNKPKDLPTTKKELLQDRLEKLLSVGGSIAVVAKAISVMMEQDRTFCGARILSDMRPVFSESPDEVTATVLMHSLNITFHQEGEHREIYLAFEEVESPAEPEPITSLELEFNQRADRWERETAIHSSPAAKYLHKDYQFIMAKGEKVIPLILTRLERSRKDWFWALQHIAGEDENPAKDAENFDDAVRAWREWARRKNYIP